MKCSACGAEASGKFCYSCGEPLGVGPCPSCGADVSAETRFCTNCGTELKGGRKRSDTVGHRQGSEGRPRRSTGGSGGAPEGNTKLAWTVAGVLLVVVFFVLGYPVLTGGSGSGTGMGPAVPAGSGGEQPGLVDLTTMTLEEQATVLFNRVMSSSSSGDTADVDFFLPKALIIYEQVNPTDPDGLYHFALLHQVGGESAAALAKAQEGLSEIPDYLLLLAVAAEASASLGDEEGARGFYSRFLEVYEDEMARMRPGYEHHQPIFPVYREEALAFLNRG